MFRVPRRWASRFSAALAAAGLAAAGVMAGTTPASAQGQDVGGATAVLGGLTTAGPAVIHSSRGDQDVSAGLFDLEVDGGGSLQTYCVDILHPTQRQARYQETSWDQSTLSSNKDAGRINWILQHSYPQVDDLARLAGETGEKAALTKEQAAAGTQVAIWRFSDHVKVNAKDPKAEKLADWLTKSAKSVKEPAPSLRLSPAAVSGKAGERLGPVTVRTSAGAATVAVDPAFAAKGVRAVDGSGKAVVTAANGGKLYFDIPEDAEAGTSSLTVRASTTVPVGRVFTGTGVNEGSQTQILAGSSASTVEARATATWAGEDAKGPIPAITTQNNCAKGGVDISVTNKGDEDFVFQLAGGEHTIKAGTARTVFWPVGEDKAYEIKIALPDGTDKVFKGVLNCRTDSSTGGSPQPSSHPTPASVGGGSTGGSTSGSTTGGDLAATGSSSATPVIAGVAVGLLVVGGAAVFLLRKRKSPGSGE
ncbi:thioester domain-containing protein [Wenjunlia tyrosinilytica]|uniref:TQXA domain-containing protein n=1 Tax=Wenjunlia tyrosinilytica TaxID=1544741 RepID=A0A917ZDL6_9ACTN|nr:thioester domain-containing protein [Wenjunlia tyrosinilytica]GGO81055.1 TQXA domain-containing protein [Wenjunlia tyrosinilytica]